MRHKLNVSILASEIQCSFTAKDATLFMCVLCIRLYVQRDICETNSTFQRCLKTRKEYYSSL